MTKHICWTWLILYSLPSFSQEYNIPFNHLYYKDIEVHLLNTDIGFHSSIKPYRIGDIKDKIPYDSLSNIVYHHGKFSNTLVGRKLLKENLIIIDSTDYRFTIDPLFNFQLGFGFGDEKHTQVNTRGIAVTGSIGKNFSFYTDFYENQATFANYLDDYIHDASVVPGQGKFKNFDFSNRIPGLIDKIFKSSTQESFKVDGFDYSMASGYISYTPSSHFNFQLGHGQNFIGDGYRSLLLSDAGFNYPFLKITSTFWKEKLRYVNLLTVFQTIREQTARIEGASFRKKFASFHYLNWLVNKRLQIGVFEGVVFNSGDTARGGNINYNYFNPVLFFRPIQYGLNGEHNVILGFNFSYKPFKSTMLYGQIALDDLDVTSDSSSTRNKLGFQAGLKAYNLFKIPNLSMLFEFNQVLPYTYAHEGDFRSIAHYSQPLSHPAGANFREVIGELNYRYKAFRFDFQLHFIQKGIDTSLAHFGGDIFRLDSEASEYLNAASSGGLRGPTSKIIYADFQFSYLVNPRTNMNLFVGISHRKERFLDIITNTNFIYFGWRTSFVNHYYDY